MTRVHLFRGRHPLYETFLTHPPQGVEYLPPRATSGPEEYTLYRSRQSLLRKSADMFFRALGTPRFAPILGPCDLVHSCRGFFVFGPHPFVVDVEHVASFTGMNYAQLRKNRTKALIRRWLLSDRCCGILPHSEAARRTLALVVGEGEISDKTNVLYPTVDLPLRRPPARRADRPAILFIGEYYWKGGREVINACHKLASRQDFKLTYISVRVPPPDKVLERARRELDLEYFAEPVPRSDLIAAIYPSADIFAMPTYLDTFGYAFLEAMASGLPCVGTKHFAVPEIVQNEVTGLNVSPPVSYFDETGMGHPEIHMESVDTAQTTNELCICLERLLSSRNLRERMGREGLNAVTEGRFSIDRRNHTLKEVYGRCLGR